MANATIAVLHNFNDTNGVPTGDVTLVGGKLYGMTNVNELSPPYRGSIFSMDTNGNNYRVLHEFDSANGFQPHFGSLTYSSGILYGTTTQEGTHGWGFIFSIDTNGNNYKDMFDFDGIHGAFHCGSLTLTGRKLYGMAYRGGGANWGCIYSIDTNGSGIEDVYDFIGGNMGSEPFGALTISGSKMYGMTSEVENGGNVFSIDTDGGEYTGLRQFNYMNNGQPYGSLTLSKTGVLYGMTTELSGPPSKSGMGNIFSIDTDGSKYKDLHDFNGKNGDKYPFGSLTPSGHTLYGIADYTIFSIDTSGNEFKNMFYLNGVNGSGSCSSLTLSGNVLYGMASAGGANNYGVIFKIDTDAIAEVKTVSNPIQRITVYPNPSTGLFTLSLTNVHQGCSIKFYNVLGQQVYGSNINSDNTEINISTQPNGVYLYRVTTLTGELVGEGKLLIQK